MTAVALPPVTRPGRRGFVTGVVLLVPRLVLAWFLGLDALQLIAAFLMIAGFLFIGVGLFRIVLAARRDRPLWPVGLAGVGLVVLAGVISGVFGRTQYSIVYEGGVVPPSVVLYQYFWTILVPGVWIIGIVFALGSVLLALARRRYRG